MEIDTLRQNPDLVRLNPDLQEVSNSVKKCQEPSKYRNVRTVYRGREYASKREAERARILDTLIPAEIVAWFPQVPFVLAGGIRYLCDFLVILPDGTWRAEDVKGVRTDVYKLKRRLFKEAYGREIVEVR